MKRKVFKLFKRLITTQCYFALIISCGKQIETTDGGGDRVVDRPNAQPKEIALNLTIDTNEGKTKTTTFSLAESGWAKIPHAPYINRGGSRFIYSKITLNKSEEIDQEIFCEYFSTKQETTDTEITDSHYKHMFTGCYAYIDGVKEEVNYEIDQEYPVDSGNQIELTIHASSADQPIEVSSEISVDWL